MTQRTAAWYDKPPPPFVDAIALVRHHRGLRRTVFHGPLRPDTQDLPVALYRPLVDSLACAA